MNNYEGEKLISNEDSRIKTLNDFIKWANNFSEGEFVFRGVPNEVYTIQASAYRRPADNERNFEKFLYINKDLISKAKQRGYDKKDGTEWNELDILVELQHFKAATCLIDFTFSAQIALWFACQPMPIKKGENGESGDDEPPNGKVSAVQIKPPKFTEITPEFWEKGDNENKEARKKIDFYLKEDKDSPLYYLQPKFQNNRIIAQQSVFLFGQYELDSDGECVIEAACKEDILKELHRVSGITEDKLFPDFEGFAWIHREGALYTEPTPSALKEQGQRAFDSENYDDAIENFSRVIEKDANDVEAYNLRGRAYTRQENYDEALIDYNEAIRINPDYIEAYFNRGMLNDERKKYEDAISDFTKALSLKPNYDDALFHRGRMNFLLNQNVEALGDFTEVIKLDSDSASAYCFRGIVRIELEQYHAAIRDLTKSINLDNTLILSYYERANANFFLGRSEEATSDLEKALALVEEQNNDEFLSEILDLLNEIDSHTFGGSQDE